MAAYQWPVLIWSAPGGGTTAVLVGDYKHSAAHAATEREALQQLKDFLDWRAEHERWGLEPDLVEPELIEVKVEVRPQYQNQHRLIPCPDTVTLRVPCVLGKSEDGAPACEVPHLALRFTYQDVAALKDLIRHYVKDKLHGLTPLDLASQLPPAGARLTQLSVREAPYRTRRIPFPEREEFKVLMSVADPLLQDRARGSAAYGREQLSLELERKLQHEQANVLLVGEPGVGKSTLLLDAARRLSRRSARNADADEDEDRSHSLYRFWRGSGARTIAGMSYLGQWEERCENFIAQLARIDGVFCAENLLDLARIGGRDASDSVAAFLLPYLQRGELRMVAEATSEEVEACRRLLPSLLDVFQVVHVPAFNDSETLAILQRIASAHASSTRLDVALEVTPLVQRLFKRFLPYAVFPGPAAAFLRRLCDERGKVERTSASEPHSLTADHVVEHFIRQTGLPEIFLRDEQTLPFEDVREYFAGQIIGQPTATAAAAQLVASIKSGLTDSRRPCGVYLFCGPTGVGKTALARSLAEFCFGAGAEKERLIRLDMSEFGALGSSSRLLHSPDGNPAAWIQRARRQPFCVVVFDEIEKAAPEVFDVLLGLLDEGRLTDRFGRVTNFRSAIIVLTSNLGASSADALGFAQEDAGPAYDSAVMKFFRPEFFNRLDGVITFEALTPANVRKIAEKELADLNQREGLRFAGLRLEWTERVAAVIAHEGYDRRFGARPLQRTLERLVVTPLARWRVAHPVVRDVTLHLDLDSNGRVTFEAK
jgi:ATP-dependent Clp protease ATP-binding subunit ClpC